MNQTQSCPKVPAVQMGGKMLIGLRTGSGTRLTGTHQRREGPEKVSYSKTRHAEAYRKEGTWAGEGGE